MSSFFTLNPITKKRLQRFCAIRRAYWSFWILTVTYIASLLASFYCNNVPLLVKFNNQYYFPILFNYFKNDFDPNENKTIADYKSLKNSPIFLENENNYMVFPPIPYGPTENIPIQHLSLPRDISVKIEREPKIGSVDINEDLTIRKVDSPEFFFDENQTYRKSPLSDFMMISDETKKAISDRFSNTSSPEFKQETSFNNRKIIFKLLAFTPDESKPSKIRAELSNIDTSIGAVNYSQTALYSEEGKPINEPPKIWSKLSEQQQKEVYDKIIKRAANYVDPLYLPVDQDTWKVSFERKDPFYPYKPTAKNPFGFDESGRDVLTQLIYGYRNAMSFGIILVAFTLLIGTVIGAVQGYFGGKTDLLGQRLIEIWSALPFLYIMIFLGNVYGKSFVLLLIVYGIFNWISISYYIRAEFLKLRKASYVEAAKCMGISDFNIMLRHIMPNALVSITTFFPFMLIGAIGSLTVLDFLGFGLPADTPSWGVLLKQGNTHLNSWWLIFFPSLALFFVMLLGTLIGDGLRAAFDPRKFHKIE